MLSFSRSEWCRISSLASVDRSIRGSERGEQSVATAHLTLQRLPQRCRWFWNCSQVSFFFFFCVCVLVEVWCCVCLFCCCLSCVFCSVWTITSLDRFSSFGGSFAPFAALCLELNTVPSRSCVPVLLSSIRQLFCFKMNTSDNVRHV